MQYSTINSRYITVLYRPMYWGLSFIFNIGISLVAKTDDKSTVSAAVDFVADSSPVSATVDSVSVCRALETPRRQEEGVYPSLAV